MTTTQTTKDSLGIFWEGEETDGFTLYGYWPRASVALPVLAFDALAEVNYKTSQLSGDDWTVWLWDIKVRTWPSKRQWRLSIRQMLQQIVNSGAVVSWGALEGSFIDPPCLFDPSRTERSVWAAVTAQGDLFGPADLDDAFITLTDQQLTRLRSAARLSPCLKVEDHNH